MEQHIADISAAIADGTLSLDDAVRFTVALAEGSWGVVAKLAHQIAQLG